VSISFLDFNLAENGSLLLEARPLDLLLGLNESIEVFLEFQLIASATVNEELRFSLSIGFTNDGTKVPSPGKVP
jgi:hypothetical protein